MCSSDLFEPPTTLSCQRRHPSAHRRTMCSGHFPTTLNSSVCRTLRSHCFPTTLTPFSSMSPRLQPCSSRGVVCPGAHCCTRCPGHFSAALVALDGSIFTPSMALCLAPHFAPPVLPGRHLPIAHLALTSPIHSQGPRFHPRHWPTASPVF